MNTPIKKFRLEKGLSQTKIAKLANISETHFQNIEYGKVKPNIYLAQKLALILETTVNKLFPINDFNNNSEPDPHQIQNEEKTNI